jgi:hypothetical protein
MLIIEQRADAEVHGHHCGVVQVTPMLTVVAIARGCGPETLGEWTKTDFENRANRPW